MVGLVVFAVLLAAGVAVLALDGPLAWIGRAVQRVRNRLRRDAPPLTRLPQRLMRERDRMLGTLGPRWKRALLAAVGAGHSTTRRFSPRWRRSARTRARRSFCSPSAARRSWPRSRSRPGGLGFVEAGLTAMLTLAGVTAGDAVLATFAYRLFSYWLPLPLGLVGAIPIAAATSGQLRRRESMNSVAQLDPRADVLGVRWT